MRIGLVRHFKVNCTRTTFMTSKEFKELEQKYNNSDVTKNKVEFDGIIWDKCYASTLSRAITTAENIYFGDIVKSDLIREVPIFPIFKSNLKLPYWFWGGSCRIAWYLNHPSQEEQRRHTKANVKKFLDLLEAEAKEEKNENILVVTHGFFMCTLQQELKKRGFLGKINYTPKNGTLYLYKKD